LPRAGDEQTIRTIATRGLRTYLFDINPIEHDDFRREDYRLDLIATENTVQKESI
jgi:hypothetical protein